VASNLDLFNVRSSLFANDLTCQAGVFHGEWQKWYPQSIVGTSPLTPLSAPVGLGLNIVAATNPSRPSLTIPELAQDLLQIPSQIRELGELLRHPSKALDPSGASDTYLGIKFGWLPLIKDLQDLANLQNLVNQRDRELQKLYSGSGLKRRIDVASDTVTSSSSQSWLACATINASTTISITDARRSWATIHWRPTQPPKYHPHTDGYNRQLRKLVLGLTPEGAVKGLWNVIPWTWLAGWFSNFGNYLQQFSNTVPASHDSVCFMSEVHRTYQVGSTTYSGTPFTSRSGTGPTGSAVHVRKTRQVLAHAFVAGSMPYVGIDKLSVLGALFAQRFLRR